MTASNNSPANRQDSGRESVAGRDSTISRDKAAGAKVAANGKDAPNDVAAGQGNNAVECADDKSPDKTDSATDGKESEKDTEQSPDQADGSASKVEDGSLTLLPAQEWLAHLQNSQAASERLQGDSAPAGADDGTPEPSAKTGTPPAKTDAASADDIKKSATDSALSRAAKAAQSAAGIGTTAVAGSEAGRTAAYHAASAKTAGDTGHGTKSTTSAAASDTATKAAGETVAHQQATTSLTSQDGSKLAVLAENGHAGAHQMVWSAAVHAMKAGDTAITAATTSGQESAGATLADAAQSAAGKGSVAASGPGGNQLSADLQTAATTATAHSSLASHAAVTPDATTQLATGNGMAGVPTAAASANPNSATTNVVLPGSLQLTPLSQGVQALAEHVTLMMGQNLQQAEIQLDPQGLGRMTVQLSMEREQASVHFVVQHAQTRELLEQALPRLRDMLSGQGIQLSQGSVQQQGHESSGQQAWGQAMAGQQSQSGQGGSYRGQSGNAASDESGLPDVQNFGIRSTSATGIDFYA